MTANNTRQHAQVALADRGQGQSRWIDQCLTTPIASGWQIQVTQHKVVEMKGDEAWYPPPPAPVGLPV